jgi:5-hydroxyisourate hydrolase
MSQITTHVLDTTRGKPAAGVTITMYEKVGLEWVEIAEGITNTDGRIGNLLSDDDPLPLGVYKLHFATEAYFKVLGIESFYPCVEITFEISTTEHYHVPLLLNPFGYSTYRGS